MHYFTGHLVISATCPIVREGRVYLNFHVRVVQCVRSFMHCTFSLIFLQFNSTRSGPGAGVCALLHEVHFFVQCSTVFIRVFHMYMCFYA